MEGASIKDLKDHHRIKETSLDLLKIRVSLQNLKECKHKSILVKWICLNNNCAWFSYNKIDYVQQIYY